MFNYPFPWDTYTPGYYPGYWPTYTVTNRIPHKCPVCEGRTFVARGFYGDVADADTTTGPLSEPCRACSGTGIVYSQVMG